MNSQELALKAKNLYKSYRKGKKVVDNATLEVKKGEIVGLLGPNGAGKTTIFRIIVGLLNPDAGEVLLAGNNITTLPMYKRAKMGIAYLPQEHSIFQKLTVKDNLTAITELMKIPVAEKKARVDKLLEEFDLQKLSNQKAYTLSGGEKRRCEIARLLLLEPYFFLLDEPFSGIDPKTVTEIQNIISHLRSKNIGILITDHNVRDTLKIIDRAYIISEGKILLEGTSVELLESPEARSVYLGEEFEV
ncbi:MAG: LPS export ABC transporter ATP-binding protein [Elusimicrobiota bacterium]|nr:LPS export ABC transporter ATP-binding protein [Elusimicrobiota bacterium]